VLLLNVNRAAVRCKAIVFQNLSMEELFMNNINFYNRPIIVLLLGFMHVGNSYCMENGENALTLRGQLKGRGNWITHISDQKESTSLNAMENNQEDLKKMVQGTMVMSAKVSLYKDNEHTNKNLNQQLKEEHEIEELAKYYAQKTINMIEEKRQTSIPIQEAFRSKYPQDYQRIAELRRISVYNKWTNKAEQEKEYSMLLQKERQFLKEYVLDKKQRGLALNEYEERNLQDILTWEKYKETK
jgi:hypothetical protein